MRRMLRYSASKNLALAHSTFLYGSHLGHRSLGAIHVSGLLVLMNNVAAVWMEVLDILEVSWENSIQSMVRHFYLSFNKPWTWDRLNHKHDLTHEHGSCCIDFVMLMMLMMMIIMFDIFLAVPLLDDGWIIVSFIHRLYSSRPYYFWPLMIHSCWPLLIFTILNHALVTSCCTIDAYHIHARPRRIDPKIPHHGQPPPSTLRLPLWEIYR